MYMIARFMSFYKPGVTSVSAANGNNDIMAAYFPVMMSPLSLNWLEALPAGSINSWQDLCNTFI